MAYFNIKERRYIPQPIPPTPPYVPPTPPTPPQPESGSTPILPVPEQVNSTSITLYSTYSEVSALNKKLSSGIKIDIAFKDDISEINPVILLEVDGNLTDYNYAYIEYSNRYYYIIDKQLIQGNIWRLVLKTDVLMSFRSEISDLVGILNRAAMDSDVNPDFPDESFYLNGNSVSVYLSPAEGSTVPRGLNSDGEWVLVTVGKTVE